MKVTIIPSKCSGIVRIPPSKSISHRAIICACLAKGRSVVRNIAFSEDIEATINGMRQLGAGIAVHSDFIEIDGIGEIHRIENNKVYCNESGSTLRFFIPIFSLTNQEICFEGKKRLMQRPQEVYKKIFTDQNIEFHQTNECITIAFGLKPSEFTLDGNVSSQFITGLLFALPLLDKTSIIHIKPPFQSRSYVNITIQVMQEFGVYASFLDENTIVINGNQQYKPCDYTVEGDYSQLAFFAVLGVINNTVDCIGISRASLQGDCVILDILNKCSDSSDESSLCEEITGGYRFHKADGLKGIKIDLGDCPDLGPVLTILAMFCLSNKNNGNAIHIYNAGRLRLKESDRISAMQEELLKLGVCIETTNDEIIIKSKGEYEGSAKLFAHNDHRIAMSLAIAASCCKTQSTIDGAECINKSYPAFFEDLKKIGIKVQFES